MIFFKKIENSIALRSKRERLLMLGIGITLPVFLVSQMAIVPALEKIESADRASSALSIESTLMKNQVQIMQSGKEKQRLNALLISRTNENEQVIKPLLNDAKSHLLAPQKVSRFLRELIPGSVNLKLVSIKSYPPLKQLKSAGLFQHPFDVEFDGSYQELVNYMVRIESSQWRMLIDQMSLERIEESEEQKMLLDTPSVSKIRLKIRVSAFSDSSVWLSDLENMNGKIMDIEIIGTDTKAGDVRNTVDDKRNIGSKITSNSKGPEVSKVFQAIKSGT